MIPKMFYFEPLAKAWKHAFLLFRTNVRNLLSSISFKISRPFFLNNRQNDNSRTFARAFSIVLIFFLIISHFLAGSAVCEESKGDNSPFALNEIVVSSERIQEYIKNHPQNLSIVERKEIEERNLSTAEDILKVVPGVEVHSSSGIGSRISIRGSGKSGGVLILLNGRPLNTNQYGNFDLNSIPVDIIESLMVFKPPVPVWLGPGGSEGVINIVTRNLPAQADKKKTHSSIKASGGSFGFAEGAVSRQMSIADGGALITAMMKHRDGKRPNSDRTDGSLGMMWNREDQKGNKIEVGGRYYESENGSPGPVDNLTPDARQRYRKGSLETRYSGIMSERGTFSVNAYGDITQLKDKSQSGFTSKLDDYKLGIKLDTTWSQPKGIWDLRLGGMLEWNDLTHTLTGGHHRIRSSLSGQYDRILGPFTGTFSFRGDYTNDFGFNPGFTLGISGNLTQKCLFKIRAGYTINVPTFEQLYQSAHGSIDQSRGNPELKKEKVRSYDFGIEYKLQEGAVFNANIFRADTDDLISYKRGDDKIYMPINIANAQRQGIEVGGKYEWGKGLITEINIIIQDSKNSNTGKELPYTPKLKIRCTQQYTLPSLKTRLEGTVRYEGRRFNQLENLPTQEMDDYISVDIKLTQPFSIKKINAEWFLKVDNLFNASYQSHYGYPDDGIRFITGLQVRF